MSTSIQRRTRRMLMWLLIIPLILGAIGVWTAARYRSAMSWVSHTKNVLVEVEQLFSTITLAENNLRGFLLTDEASYKQTYQNAKADAFAKISHLLSITRDNQKQQRYLRDLNAEIRENVGNIEAVLQLKDEQRLSLQDASATMRERTSLMAVIQKTCALMTAEEATLLIARTRERERTEIYVGCSFAAGIVISMILLYQSYLMVGRYGAERDRAEAEIKQINASLEARIDERTAELLAANEDLKRSNSDLTQFAYVASHDLQEPLRTVGSYAGLLGRRYQGKLDDQADKYIRFIVDGAKRMQNLVQDLLMYSRVGTERLTFEQVELASIFQTVKENLRVAILERKAVLSHGDLPSLTGDATKMTQLVQNLVTNALKFSKPDEAPRIHIDAKLEGREWVVSISDNGIGFDQAYADRIFIIFQRLHQIGTYPGTGMGLAICRRIAEAHGGRIWAESEEGVGSTFLFTIPSKLPSHNIQMKAFDPGAVVKPIEISGKR